jgi:hypothetical protein
MARGNLSTLKHFTPKWKSGATQVVRIPIVLTPQVMSYARSLDNKELPSDTFSNPNHLLQVIRILEEVSQTPRNNFGKEPKAKLQKAINMLNSLVTSESIE